MFENDISILQQNHLAMLGNRNNFIFKKDIHSRDSVSLNFIMTLAIILYTTQVKLKETSFFLTIWCWNC